MDAGRTHDGDGLTPGEVLRAARSLISEHGLSGLSMRRLADELGVWPTSIYYALGEGAGKDDLVRITVDSILGATPLPPDEGPWDARFRTWCEGLRQGLLPYPGVAEWLLLGVAAGPHGVRRSEALLRILRDAGLLREERSRYFITVFMLVLPTVQAEIGAKRGAELAKEQQRAAAAYARVMQEVPEHESALTRDFLAWLPSDPPDGQYRWGIEVLVRAIDERGRHRQRRADRRAREG